MKDSAAKLSHQKVTEELQRKISSIHPYLEVETTTLGGLDEEEASAGFLVGPAACFGFEELVLLAGPLVGFLGRRRGILNLVCFFSYSSAKSAIVCVRSTFVSQIQVGRSNQKPTKALIKRKQNVQRKTMQAVPRLFPPGSHQRRLRGSSSPMAKSSGTSQRANEKHLNSET